MEAYNPRIPIMERFDIISHLMPFYGPTHKSFLLLSTLWVGSRNKLDEFYEEFVRWMYNFRMQISLTDDLDASIYPNDLFEFNISRISMNNVDSFIQMITKLSWSSNLFFNKHYMHSQIKISRILVLSSAVPKLIPYIDALKSVKVLERQEIGMNYSIKFITKSLLTIAVKNNFQCLFKLNLSYCLASL